MKRYHLVILDYSSGAVTHFVLSEEDSRLYDEEGVDFEEFYREHLWDKTHIDIDSVSWMLSDSKHFSFETIILE